MSDERWERVKDLFSEAALRPPSQRETFLAAAAGGDEALCREVLSLLMADAEAGSFMEPPAVSVTAATAVAEQHPALMIGHLLGHYRLEAELGAGGMGVVYRAHDTRLGRTVAVKLLNASTVDDDARARLLREAQSASVINHPHVCTIHEVGHENGRPYIVMEYVDGDRLRDRIPRGGMPLDILLRYGSQIADALAHMHQGGVVHHDLKSSNVVITQDGRVKVLDFGIARRLSADAPDVMASELPTQSGIAGTPGYLPPEVLLRRPTDARSDIWTLGVLLYEMATGRLPFAGDTLATLTSTILREPPEPLPANIPAGLRATILRCLAKEPNQRYQRAGEVRAALDALQPSARAGWRTSPARVASRVAIVVTALAASIILANVGHLRDFLTGASHVRSVAVLPLKNLSGDSTQDYFADGFTDTLIADLAQVTALRVTSTTSVMQYKGTKKALPVIARELGVDKVVEGSIVREGNRVRITVQLIDAPTDQHIWAANYERDLRDILGLQGEVARSVAHEVGVRLTPTQEGRLASRRVIRPEVHELFLKATDDYNRGVTGRAIQEFEQVLVLDPQYASAHVRSARAYGILALYGLASPSDVYPKMRLAATKALEKDPGLAGAHSALALVRLHEDWNWAEAEIELKRALELNPSDADTHHDYAHYLMAMGRQQESLSETRRALELDPVDGVLTACLGWHQLYAGQYDSTIHQGLEGISLRPTLGWAHTVLGWGYEQKGMLREAVSELQNAVPLWGGAPFALASLGHALALSGDRDGALGILQKLNDASGKRYVSPYDFAVVYAGLSDLDRAFESMQKAFDEHTAFIIYMKWDPRLRNARTDRRFAELLRRMNFPT